MPLASFFRTTVAGGKLMVWQQMVMFCPSGTTAEGRMRIVVFLGGAGPQEESFSRKDRDLLLQFFFWPAGGPLVKLDCWCSNYICLQQLPLTY